MRVQGCGHKSLFGGLVVIFRGVVFSVAAKVIEGVVLGGGGGG